MSVSKEQTERARGYVNQVFELLREAAGEGFNLTVGHGGTDIRIRKQDDYLHGNISFREEKRSTLFGRDGNGKLYIVVDAPGYHGKVFKETNNFEEQFGRAVDFLMEYMTHTIKTRERSKRLQDAKDEGRKIVREQLKGLVTDGPFFTGIDRKIEHRTVSCWGDDGPFAEVKFTLHIDGVKPEGARDMAEKVIAFMKEIGQL